MLPGRDTKSAETLIRQKGNGQSEAGAAVKDHWVSEKPAAARK
jgi:hypothetical protein